GFAQDRNRDYDYRNQNQNRRGRSHDDYGNYGGSFQLRQTALNAGYNEGMKDFQKDQARGRITDFRTQRAYQTATKDYSSRLGDRELYRRYFREAYENGYTVPNPDYANRNRDSRNTDTDWRHNDNRNR